MPYRLATEDSTIACERHNTSDIGEGLGQSLVHSTTKAVHVVEDDAHVTTTKALARPHGKRHLLQVVVRFVALGIGELTTDANVVVDDKTVTVGDATLLVEGDGDGTLFDLARGEGGDHEAGGHEGEEDGLDGHQHVRGCFLGWFSGDCIAELVSCEGLLRKDCF